MTLRALLKRIRTDAGRLKAAATGQSKRSARPASAALSPSSSSALSELSQLYPGLPGPALKEAVLASVAGVEVGEHGLTRFAMYAALSERLADRDALGTRVLSISGSTRLAKVLGFKAAKVLDAAYPEHTMLALGFADASFDACVSDQVLEHVEGNPFAAVQESFRVVKPGGFVVHTTCLMNPIHREPGDFWRFTTDALALLCREAGGEDIETGSWGNRAALALTELGIRTQKIPKDVKHPLHRIATVNERDWPVHTWVIARRRLSR